jgi:hypothetical protein
VKKIIQYIRFKNENGVSLVLVALLLIPLIGIGALVVDLGMLYAARNQLQNAADAGALGGTRVLYNEDGTQVNANANQVAYDAARDNSALSGSGVIAVDVDWDGGNGGDVQRGHWSFAEREFTPNASLDPVDLWDRTAESLDSDTNFINAVKVVARRKATPVSAVFSTIFGRENFELSAEAVAYIGFAGSLRPHDVDQPIAICKQSIIDENGNYNCNTGRMIDSGGGTTHNTAAWTNFSQPCQTASANSVKPLVCKSGNLTEIFFGNGMGTTGGMQDNVYTDLRDCWLEAALNQDWRGYPRNRWSLTLPVIDCPENNPGPCSVVVGTVTLDVIWVKKSGTDPQWNDVPFEMEHWECSEWVDAGRPTTGNMNNPPLSSTQRQQCFQEFATEFNLKTANGTSVATLTPSDIQKTMFFLPSCETHEPRGVTGGENFGVLARVPVLVN